MQTAGIIIEYNPMHDGHLYLLEQVRAQLGADTAFVGVMSGNFVQRGDFALLRKHARARAAVESGVDLVLELPLPWAVASAERFARGGVEILSATGVVTHLAFGSECGDAAALERLAEALHCEAFPALLRRELERGDSFPAARQRALAQLTSPKDAALLSDPNNILGVEYCKALLQKKSAIRPLTVRRVGTPYHGTDLVGAQPSATLLRTLLRSGERDRALALMPPAVRRVYEAEEAAGRAPVFRENAERAMLARLRSMTEADFARLDEGREGLYRRLYETSRSACSIEALLDETKTRRYARTRLSRMVLWAYLGLEPAAFPRQVPYLRVLAANGRGRELLGRMRKCAELPILTKPADVRELPPAAGELFRQEVRATDLYTLAYPDLFAAAGGTEWREGPVILP